MSAIFDMELQEDAEQLHSESDYEDDTVFFIFVSRSTFGKFRLESSDIPHVAISAHENIRTHVNALIMPHLFLSFSGGIR